MLSVDKQAGVSPNNDKQFFTSGFMLERIEYCSVTVILHVRTRHHFSFWFEEMKKKTSQFSSVYCTNVVAEDNVENCLL